MSQLLALRSWPQQLEYSCQEVTVGKEVSPRLSNDGHRSSELVSIGEGITSLCLILDLAACPWGAGWANRTKKTAGNPRRRKGTDKGGMVASVELLHTGDCPWELWSPGSWHPCCKEQQPGVPSTSRRHEIGLVLLCVTGWAPD